MSHKKVLLGLCMVLMTAAFVPMVHAKDKAAPALHPNLRKILEEQAQKESDAWNISNAYYAKTCLKDVTPGKDVPKDKAVSTTECYIGAIDKNVRPVALNQEMVDDMTGEWTSLARKYGAGQITHKQWMDGMHSTQKKFAAARIQIIEGLVADAAKEQMKTPTAKTSSDKDKDKK